MIQVIHLSVFLAFYVSVLQIFKIISPIYFKIMEEKTHGKYYNENGYDDIYEYPISKKKKYNVTISNVE